MRQNSITALNNSNEFFGGNPRTPQRKMEGEQWRIQGDASAPANPGIKHVIYHSNIL